MFALLGGGVRVRVGTREQRKIKKDKENIKGTTKPLMANLDTANKAQELQILPSHIKVPPGHFRVLRVTIKGHIIFDDSHCYHVKM